MDISSINFASQNQVIADKTCFVNQSHRENAFPVSKVSPDLKCRYLHNITHDVVSFSANNHSKVYAAKANESLEKIIKHNKNIGSRYLASDNNVTNTFILLALLGIPGCIGADIATKSFLNPYLLTPFITGALPSAIAPLYVQKKIHDIKSLVKKHNADPNLSTLHHTPLGYLAKYYDRPHIIEALVKCGADVNLKDGDGYTPLMYAISNDHEKTARLLMKLGADPTIKDKNDCTAFDNGVYGDKYRKIYSEMQLKELFETKILRTQILESKSEDEIDFEDADLYLKILDNEELSQSFKEKLFNKPIKPFSKSLLLYLLEYIAVAYCDEKQYAELLDKLSELDIDYTQCHQMFGSVFEMILDKRDTGLLKLLKKSGQKVVYEKVFDDKYRKIPDSKFKEELDKVKYEIIVFPDIDVAMRMGNKQTLEKIMPLFESPFCNLKKYRKGKV